jgi:hypothetical protein
MQSFRNMRRMEATLREARALRLRYSQSLPVGGNGSAKRQSNGPHRSSPPRAAAPCLAWEHPQRLRYDVRNLDPVAGSRARTFSSDHFPLLMKCSSDYAEARSDASRLDGRGHHQRKGPLALTISSTYIRS